MSFSKEQVISILGNDLVEDINKFLGKYKQTTNVDSISDLLEFVPDNEKEQFLNNIKECLSKNKNCLDQIVTSIDKLDKIMESDAGSRCAALFLYALGDKLSNITSTVEHTDGFKYNEILKMYDKSSFFVLDWAYNEYTKKYDYYGRKKEQGKSTFQWVMPTTEADKIIKELNKIKGSDSKQKRKEKYQELLGLTKLPEDNSFWHIEIDVEKLKKLAEVEKRLAMFFPNKSVPGANDFWIPGGFTSGGLPVNGFKYCSEKRALYDKRN